MLIYNTAVSKYQDFGKIRKDSIHKIVNMLGDDFFIVTIRKLVNSIK